MKIGIIGLSRSGKSIVFDILTGVAPDAVSDPTRSRVGMASVPDGRVRWLSEYFKPKKTTYSTIEFTDFAAVKGKGQGFPPQLLQQMRTVDGLLVVLRGFDDASLDPAEADPGRDFDALMQELVLADLSTVEPNLERARLGKRKGLKVDPAVVEAFEILEPVLAEGKPAITVELSEHAAGLIRGYGLLTLKPILAVANVDEDSFRNRRDEIRSQLASGTDQYGSLETLVLSAFVERDIMEIDEGDRPEFMADLGLEEIARDRLIRSCFTLLDQICFFTVGEDEVRSWTLRRGTVAQKAAGTIHSDLEKGFIRAEVTAYDEFKELGGFQQVKKEGKFRLEGKEYPVLDGDILNIRFNV